MANGKDKKEEKKPPLHEVLISMMTNDEKVLEMPGMDATDGWARVVVAANVLALAEVPEDAVPAIQEAAKKAWEDEEDEDAKAALENLAQVLGFELPGEESQEEKPEE